MAERRHERTRGEGYVEYVVVLSLIMICAIVGLFTAGSETVRALQNTHGICESCPKPTPPPPAYGGPGGADNSDHGSGNAGSDTPASPATPPSSDPSPPSDPSASLPAGGGFGGDPTGGAGGFWSSPIANIIGWFRGWW